MSIIYAPIDAVNKHKTFHTILPADVNLTVEQKNTLIHLERMFDKGFTENNIKSNLQTNFNNTTNVGIHFFCIENRFALSTLAKNKNLSSLSVFLLLRKIDEKNPSLGIYNSILYGLLSNPVVLKEELLFKEIFYTLSKINGSIWQCNLSPETLLKLDINLFLFLLEQGNATVMDDISMIHIRHTIKTRGQEISSYFANTEPDLADVPLSWILKAYYGLTT